MKEVDAEDEQSWFYPPLPEDAKESTDVQPKMTKLINEVKQDGFCNQMQDKHSVPTVGTRKPDIVHYRKSQPETVFNIVCLGELKGRRSQPHFRTDEIGHILEMTQVLAELQPFRSNFTCYITDTKYIQFFKMHVSRKKVPINCRFATDYC